MLAKISIILLLFLSCTVSPRYGVQSIDSTQKPKKNIKYSKKNKNSSELKGCHLGMVQIFMVS